MCILPIPLSYSSVDRDGYNNGHHYNHHSSNAATNHFFHCNKRYMGVLHTHGVPKKPFTDSCLALSEKGYVTYKMNCPFLDLQEIMTKFRHYTL